MTRAELQAFVASVREAHPQVTIRLRRELTPGGDFQVDLSVPLELEVHISPDNTETARRLREEVEVMIEQASPAIRETVRQLQADRDYADELGEAPDPPPPEPAPEPPTLWERLESP